MSTQKEWKKQKIQISVHIENGQAVDVAGLPEGVGVVVTDENTGEEIFFTSKDNCQ